MEKENTVIAGAEPENKTEVKAGAEPVKADVKESESSPEQPWHKDPRFKQDLSLLKAAKSLMEKNELESVEDLVDLIDSGKKIKGKQIDLDRIDEITAKAEKLDKYEAYWKEQEEHKKRQEEDPDQTIKRLEAQIKGRDAQEKRQRAEYEQFENTKKAISAYEKEVESLIREIEVPKEQRAFVAEFFGVNNPCNDIDISDRKAIKKTVMDGIKKKEAYDQAVIKAYLEGKQALPKINSAAGASADPQKPKIMLKDARRIFLETMQNPGG